MSMSYRGPLKLTKLISVVDVSGSEARISSEYHVSNPSTEDLNLPVRVLRLGSSALGARKATDPRVALLSRAAGALGGRTAGGRALPRVPVPGDLISAGILARVAPLTDRIIDHDLVARVPGDKSKFLNFVPTIQIGEEELVDRVGIYSVTITLPPEAKKIIWTTIPPTLVKTENNRIVCQFTKANVYPTPLSVRWIELPVDIEVTKSAREMPGNVLETTIKVTNRADSKASGITLLDDISASGAIPAPLPTNRKNLKSVSPNDKSTRVQHEVTFDLAARETKVFTYALWARSTSVSLPPTTATMNGELVALAPSPGTFFFPAPARPPTTAFALPSGFSFDYVNGGDHHLKEHGMWCDGQTYDEARQRLSWTTSCIYADDNSDDDYLWSTNHQILRFNPGFARHETTPWLAKTGNVTTHSGTFRHEGLRGFSQAVVLLRGWRFDFSGGDHHINVIQLMIANVRFDRANGEVKWDTLVTYADQNFDDNYRFLYSYTILGFNGQVDYATFSGASGGGSSAHQGEISQTGLKGFRNALVIPVGWRFDYSDSDHHINEHNFNIQNVAYASSTGKVSWLASLKYCDQNFDDNYSWQYRVVVIATNAGEARGSSTGPQLDGGGLATKFSSLDLNTLFIPITWTNGVRDGTETGVDCGGSSPARDLKPCRAAVDPGTGASSDLYSLRDTNQRNVVKTFATMALLEYAQYKGADFDAYYSDSAPEKPDRFVEAVAWYVDQHMRYVSDGLFGGAQSAYETLTNTADRGPGDFNGDCEDHAILRAALLRSLGFGRDCIFCADHHNSCDQGQDQECSGEKKSSGGHTFNIVIYKGKYRIMDYFPMQCHYWAGKQAWNQNVVDNIWNDHTGQHWSRQDVSPFDQPYPLVNYPGNPCSPSSNWDWRTYFCDVTL